MDVCTQLSVVTQLVEVHTPVGTLRLNTLEGSTGGSARPKTSFGLSRAFRLASSPQVSQARLAILGLSHEAREERLSTGVSSFSPHLQTLS